MQNLKYFEHIKNELKKRRKQIIVLVYTII